MVAILSTHHEAAYVVADLNRAGFAIRKILIISNDHPSGEVTDKIRNWRAVSPAWATIGCLNAIGAGLDLLGMTEDDLGRCAVALNANLILVVLKGTPNEVVRARRSFLEKGTLKRRVRA